MSLEGVSTHTCQRDCPAVARMKYNVDLKKDFKD